jgi:hypothetical protein
LRPIEIAAKDAIAVLHAYLHKHQFRLHFEGFLYDGRGRRRVLCVCRLAAE